MKNWNRKFLLSSVAVVPPMPKEAEVAYCLSYWTKDAEGMPAKIDRIVWSSELARSNGKIRIPAGGTRASLKLAPGHGRFPCLQGSV